ncbi:MAG TPA: CehA/McbA family metallohydrolase, partial [Planctomycetota bacterium]|nr:CehA/McbA family metallohydrolase [Planctomycetota bacterium]
VDLDGDGRLSRAEAGAGLLPERFEESDADGDGVLGLEELERSHERAAERLPNVAVPEMDSVGAMEIFVTAPQGLCDFISTMDTSRIAEWNAWYHLMNCGFPIKASGETDFPCMSGTRVGQGRVYVKLGNVDRVDYSAWCEGVRRGRSYVSDGYAHALAFEVEGKPAGDEVDLPGPGSVTVRTRVAFAAERPAEVEYGGAIAREGLRVTGDTRERRPGEPAPSLLRRVEVVVNGRVAAAREVPADDREHDLSFRVGVERSSWIAVRHFPELHTNPVTVRVGGRPVRASRASAMWARACVEQLWRVRGRGIAASERDAARQAFEAAAKAYLRIAAECPEGS